ncbi:hypothetical protein GN244_ATG17223 [Phytophthora infestans]|uniref:Uncharacterized protein n=1 Tax=Phytophthora infestans TaxID=4787 RepID=A0A833WLE8_PHYIN|nr:hypothetical protein GN244_ATG17223 [Phytophthora infestans]
MAPVLKPSGSDGPQRPHASRYSDIVIATVLGIGAGMVWNNFKDGELDRIGQFYKWYDAQEAQKKSLHADD